MLKIYTNRGKEVDIGKYLIYFAVVIFVAVCGYFLYRYLTTGTLTVTTNSKNNLIEITKAYRYDRSGGGSSSVKANTGQSVSLDSGTYEVVVSSTAFSIEREVVIKARQGISLTINLNQSSAIQSVAGVAASNMVAASGILMYTDPTSGLLYSIAANSVSLVSHSIYFSDVRWASANYGIGVDRSGSFYIIDNGSISSLSLPFSYSPSPGVQFAVAPDKTIYIASGSGLYAGTAEGRFKKIYSLDQPVSAIEASNGGVAFFEGIDTDSESKQDDRASDFYVIDTSGHVYQAVKAEVSADAWSPNGDYLAASVNGQLVVWNAQLKELDALPANGITSMSWFNNTLFYSIGSEVWSYNLARNQAALFAQPTTGQSISDIVPSGDGSYLYLAMSSESQPTTAYEVARIGLNDQRQSKIISNLQLVESAILPYTVGGCTLNYLNSADTSVVTLYSATQSAQQCEQQAQSYLRDYGQDTALISYLPLSFNF